MTNYHKPADWNYELEGKTYIKVGGYGIDDVEYIIQKEGSTYIPKLGRHYVSLECAYTQLNKEWKAIC